MFLYISSIRAIDFNIVLCQQHRVVCLCYHPLRYHQITEVGQNCKVFYSFYVIHFQHIQYTTSCSLKRGFPDRADCTVFLQRKVVHLFRKLQWLSIISAIESFKHFQSNCCPLKKWRKLREVNRIERQKSVLINH